MSEVLTSNRWSGRPLLLAYTAVLALALVATFNALPNGFTYDDRFIVVANPAVRRIIGWEQFLLLPYWPLHQSGDGYRPLAILGFALQWWASPQPETFHVVSMAMYAGVSLLVLWIGFQLVSPWAAWWSAAIFAVHPVHVEVTAGAVGQSELLAALAMLAAAGTYLSGRVSGHLSAPRQVAIAALFLAGVMAKEHALLLPLLLAAFELTVLRGRSDGRSNLLHTRFLLLFFVVASLAYVLMRSLVIPAGVVGFAPYTPFVTVNVDTPGRVLTMLAIVPHWFRLLAWPSRLSTEYGPPAYAVGAGWTPLAMVGTTMLIVSIVIAIRAARARPVVTFCLLWIAVLLLPVSNIVFPTGLLLAERTLFAPSVGACLLIGMGMMSVWGRLRAGPGFARALGLSAAGAVLLLGATRSIVRLSDWRNNLSLFRSGVIAEPAVYRNHYMLGAWYLETNRWPPAKVSLTRAVELFDRDPAVLHNLGVGYFAVADYSRAYALFARADSLMPGALDARTNMALALAAQGRYREAHEAAVAALRGRTRDPKAMQSVIAAATLAEKAARR